MRLVMLIILLIWGAGLAWAIWQPFAALFRGEIKVLVGWHLTTIRRSERPVLYWFMVSGSIFVVSVILALLTIGWLAKA